MIRIAIQSKGRLHDESIVLLSKIGIEVDESKRKFLAKSANSKVELLYMRDDDIPLIVSNGTACFGIVGLNECEERGYKVDISHRLGFGKCRLSLAIPKIDNYTGLDYFNGKKIATSYPNILNRFLKSKGIEAQVEVIMGSVEIAPSAGIADCIFDIVSSGGTLVSNGLSEVEVVLQSEAVLIANQNLDQEQREVLSELLFRINSEKQSAGMKYILMNLPKKSLKEAIDILPSMKSPTVLSLADENWCSLHSVINTSQMWEKVKQLKSIGAEGILILDVDKIIL